MNQDLAHIEASGCDFPQTKRGHERRLALLISANQLFWNMVMMRCHSMTLSIMRVVQKRRFISISAIKKVYLPQFATIAVIFFKDICRPFNPSCNDLRAYLINTLITFYKHMIMPDNIAFIRLIFERSQKDPQLALYIHEKGPKQVQLSIASALERYAENQKLVCENPLYSAQFYFGILRNLEWRILMGIEIKDSDQEILDCISYCVDRFLQGHQKV